MNEYLRTLKTALTQNELRIKNTDKAEELQRLINQRMSLLQSIVEELELEKQNNNKEAA